MKNDVYNKNINFLNEYCDFSNPNHVWILKGISRNKDNSNNPNMHNFFRRMILTCPEDIKSSYEEIWMLADNPLTNYRIYISLNSRDVTKAAMNFQKSLIDLSHGALMGNIADLQKIKLLSSGWKTELEQSTCRGTKRVLLDIDDMDSRPDNVIEFIQNNCKTIVRCLRKTVSGWAIVFDACDTRELIKQCENWNIKVDLHRDSMLFVESFKPYAHTVE